LQNSKAALARLPFTHTAKSLHNNPVSLDKCSSKWSEKRETYHVMYVYTYSQPLLDRECKFAVLSLRLSKVCDRSPNPNEKATLVFFDEFLTLFKKNSSLILKENE
jgi:hypothetical protein